MADIEPRTRTSICESSPWADRRCRHQRRRIQRQAAGDDQTDAAVVKIQVWLDRARFSPGEIDGKLGENARKALKAVAEANGLATDKLPNPEIWKALAGTGEDAVIAEYKIADKDVKGPFLEKLPAKWTT